MLKGVKYILKLLKEKSILIKLIQYNISYNENFSKLYK